MPKTAKKKTEEAIRGALLCAFRGRVQLKGLTEEAIRDALVCAFRGSYQFMRTKGGLIRTFPARANGTVEGGIPGWMYISVTSAQEFGGMTDDDFALPQTEEAAPPLFCLFRYRGAHRRQFMRWGSSGKIRTWEAVPSGKRFPGWRYTTVELAKKEERFPDAVFAPPDVL